MKRFKRFLLSTALALSFTVTMPADAKADPITAAIVTFVGLTGTAAAVATFVINSALYAAASFATSKLLMKKQGLQERQASVSTLSLGETPREAVLGETVTAGWLIDAFNFGGRYGTDTVTRCVGLADHAIDAIVGFYVGEKYYPWVGGGLQAAFSNKLSFDFRNALAAGYNPPLHVATNGAWTNSDRLCGITHIWIDTLGDDKVWTQGHPQIRFVLRGLKAYDPRKDAALGYTGPNPHVWGDRATHEFSRNAMVLRYAYQRGIYAEGYQGDPNHLLIGRGLSAEEAPPERIIAAANLCDEIVNGQPRYRADGVIRAADDFIAVEEMFAAATAGVIIQHEGGVEVEPGQAKAAVVTISDGDLVVGEPVQFSDFLPDLDGGRINSVVPSFTDPIQNWAVRSGPVRRDVADIQADGGPRELTLPLVLVTSANQADRCAEITRRLARLERRVSVVLPPEYAGLEEGDWIAWQSDRYHDGAIVRYRVEGWSLDAMWRMRLQLREIEASCFGVVTPLPDLISPPGSPFAPDALALQGVQVEPEALAGTAGETGAKIPALLVSWALPVDPAVIGIRAEVRKVGSTIVATTRTEDVSRPSSENAARASMRVTNGVPSGADVEVRLIPITSSTRPVFDAAWITVTTPNLTALTAGDSAALDRLNRIDSDGWLTKGEKPAVLAQYEAADAEYLGVATRLNAAGLTTQLNALNDAITGLQNYINALDPALSNFTADTVIVGGTLRARFQAYYLAKQAGIDALLADARQRAVAAAADADEALADIDIIFSDNWLSRAEKPRIIEQVQAIQGETTSLRAQALAFGATAQRTAYIAAYDALIGYLNTLVAPTAWNDRAVDTPIVGATLRTLFATYYIRRQEMITAQLGITDADAVEALSRLAIIDSDGWLSKGEKPQAIREWEAISVEFPILRDQAGVVGAATERTALIAAKTALDSYLSGLTPPWNDAAGDTPIIGSAFRAAFTNYYQARQNALSAISASVGADGVEALARLAVIDSDGWLSKGEKPQVIREWEAISAEFPTLRDQAGSVGATAQRTALVDAKTALDSYLSGLSPQWNDASFDTVIDGATFRARFTAYYSARQLALSAISAAVGADGTEALAALDIITSDNWLSKGEKPEIVRLSALFNGEYPGLAAQAQALGLNAQDAALAATIVAFNDYLNTLDPLWSDLTVDTPVNGATLRSRVNAVFLARTALQNAMVDSLDDAIDIVIGRLDDIASDNILSRNEKPEIIRQYNTIAAEKPGVVTRMTAVGVSSTAYVAAFDALGSYLAGLTPTWNDLSEDTQIVGTTFRQKFVDYYVAKAAADNAAIVEIGADATASLAALDIITSDGWLSKGEKPELIRLGTLFNTEYPGLAAQAQALGLNALDTALAAAITAFNNYVGGLSPAWDNLTVDTPVDGPTLRARVNAVFLAKTTLQNAMTATLDADVTDALGRLGNIASDNVLTAGEKSQVVREVAAITGEYSGLDAQAAALNITTARTAYQNAYTALVTTYLPSLDPAWNSLTTDTTVVGSTFRQRFVDYYVARQALQNAIAANLDAGIDSLENDLLIIGSDNWISTGEKSALIREQANLNSDVSSLTPRATSLGITTALTAFQTAVTALNNYLTSLSPLWSNTAVDTPVDGPTLRSVLFTAFQTKQILMDAITAAIEFDTAAVAADIAIITSDNWLSRSEKPAIIREWATLNNDYAGLAARASASSVSPTAHANAIVALNDYLNSLSPTWNNLTVDTPMTGATLRSRLETAYSTRQALLNAIFEAIDGNADAALADLAIIAADNWLSRVEKPAIIQQVDFINGEYPGLAARAQALGVSETPLATAIQAVNNYLGGLSPAWNNLAVDTPINGGTLRTLFTNAYSAKTALQNAMIGVTGTAAFRVTASHSGRAGFVAGAGSATTGLITLTPTGNTGTMSYSWERIFGDPGVSATSPSGAATSGTGSVTAGQEKQALFAWRATDSGTGITREGQVSFTLVSNV